LDSPIKVPKKKSMWAKLKKGETVNEENGTAISTTAAVGGRSGAFRRQMISAKMGNFKQVEEENRIFRKRWTEMKFQDETPSCRTLHAQITYNERLIIYGGTDMKHQDASTKQLWILEPLLNAKPHWVQIQIEDKEFILPDGLKRHKLAIRKNANQVHIIVIGGQNRTFTKSSNAH
jgi:hypothetical protein